ncbi:MAG TPA: HD domain-containing protein [Clostridiales bacterium]|nr:HD domain-containing protein [Clostridiales bacterium]HOL90838.1 HD domain-containing protein [Clostridiales bacterium]HPP35826.1 HD domain-containing protein [Clostridiales bacterium]
MVRESFLRFIYQAASMQRWNDHIRPAKGFTELDKQAHKLYYAYVLGRLEEETCPVDWMKMIEGALFEFFQRILLTDIKPPIFHMLMEKHGEQINRLVMKELRDLGLGDIKQGFGERMETYLFDPDYSRHEKMILRASHYFVTNWEFNIVYQFSKGFYGIEDTRRNIEKQLEQHQDLDCVRKLVFSHSLADFLNLIGQLRFQQRWAQTQRIPETSVAGHMLIVALLSYILTLEMDACEKRKYNNFFAGLFHDLPEVLTRDIISPVKNSVDGLSDLIKSIEEEQMEKMLLPLLPEKWRDEIRYFTDDEFSCRIILDGKTIKVSTEKINELYNSDVFSPVDGSITEFCDKFAAYMEAYLSIKHGITSKNLVDGHADLYRRFARTKIAGIDMGVIFDYFRLD